MAEKWWIYDMGLPARKVVEIRHNAGLVCTIKQVEKGKAYAPEQVPKTMQIARLIAAAPRLLKAAKAIMPAFRGDNGTPAQSQAQGCVPRLWDDEALELEAAIEEAEKLYPPYPPLADYLKED